MIFFPCLIFPFSAICDSKINPTGACTLSYSDDRILKRDGSVARISGGRCSSPEKCTNCNDGFYGDGPYCKSMYLYIGNTKLILNRKFLIVLFNILKQSQRTCTCILRTYEYIKHQVNEPFYPYICGRHVVFGVWHVWFK